MENENIIPEEEEVSILTLTDEKGEDTDSNIWTASSTRARSIWF